MSNGKIAQVLCGKLRKKGRQSLKRGLERAWNERQGKEGEEKKVFIPLTRKFVVTIPPYFSYPLPPVLLSALGFDTSVQKYSW